MPMTIFARARPFAEAGPALIAAGMFCLSASPLLAADDEPPAKGAAVTVLKAAKACFANIVEVSGTIIAREENQVRPERMGLKVAEVMVDAGDSVTAGQVLARLTLPEGGQIAVQAPVGGVISASTAVRRRDGLGQGRGAVLDHRARRVRPGRHGADARHPEASRSTRPRGSR